MERFAREVPAGGKAEAVLAAARHAFLAAGFGAVSMDAIARDAGVSKATVYAHFAGKEELFGAVVGEVCRHRFEAFSAQELDAADARGSLRTLGRRFLDLVLSPEAIAIHRIIVAEVARFPLLGEVFWQAGPERTLGQIEAFLGRAAAAGSLAVADPRRAAEQFVGLTRGELHLRHLLRLEAAVDVPTKSAIVDGAVDTFLRAFAPGADGARLETPAPATAAAGSLVDA